MRISEFFHLAIQCLIIASFVVCMVGIIYFIYFFIQKKRHKDMFLDKKKLISTALLLGYIVVIVLATVLAERSSHWWNTKMNLQPLSSYFYAWNNFKMREWRNIILNICMFIPLGMILPLYHHIFKRWWVTYLSGFGLTVMIEMAQRLSRRGIFEIDDMINNTVGCMIGFGLWALVYYFYCKVSKRTSKAVPVILKQIPLIMTIIVFSTIFIIYHQKDLGNIKQNYYQKVDVSKIKLSNQAQLSDQHLSQYVYRTKVYTEKECHQIAQFYFDKENLTIDDSLTTRYDETIIYYDQERKMSVWVDYIGASLQISFPHQKNEYQDNLSLNEVKQLLAQYRIDIPKEVTFQNNGRGEYSMGIKKLLIDNLYTNGTISCSINQAHQLCDIYYSMKTYYPYQKYQLKSSKEAYEQIEKGQFNQDYLENIGDEIIIKKVRLSYVEDTKGFMQPIYEFITNGKGIIYIPAI